MLSRNWISGGAIVLMAAAGLSVAWAIRHKQKPVPKPAAAVPTVFQGPEITLTGRLEARNIEQVDAPVAGILDAWFVEEGQEVYEDQLVGRIRNADIENAVQQAQAAVDRAEMKVAQIEAQALNAKLEVSRTTADQIRARNELDRIEKIYQRYQGLMDAGALARLTFEKTQNDYNAAKTEAESRDRTAKEAQERAELIDHDSTEAKAARPALAAALTQAKDAVAACDLHSPADGVVLARNIHQGQEVEAQAKALLTIATELTEMAAALPADPAVLARIHSGQHAFVRLDGAETPGAVREVRGAEVIVEFTSTSPVTKLGGAAQVRIVF